MVESIWGIFFKKLHSNTQIPFKKISLCKKCITFWLIFRLNEEKKKKTTLEVIY